VIDDPETTLALIQAMTEALPLHVLATKDFVARLRAARPEWDIAEACTVTLVRYADDAGGIVCQLDFGAHIPTRVFASVTHLHFDPRHELTEAITAYKKHRLDALRTLPGTA
jgi:hypothetical protein